MATRDVQQLLELDVETRLALVQELWNSIVDDTAAGVELPLSAETRALLDERLSEDDEDPGSAISWADAKGQLRRDR
jgi:putative addiction module component (TIGR02574 family)